MAWSSIHNESQSPSPPTPLHSGWLHDVSDIAPGNSAILSGNKFTFYTIHSTGIVIIALSVISCLAVILRVLQDSRKRDKWDFSDRFPFYLAVSDFLWGISNLSVDHVVIMANQVYPDKPTATILAVILSFFFGYQQLMNAGLSLYTYLKVVRRVSLNLGRWEWKLHIFVVLFLASNIGIFWSLDAYGNAGYWFLCNLNNKSGMILAIHICISATIHAACTVIAYRSIQLVITKQSQRVSLHSPFGQPVLPNRFGFVDPHRFHSTANNCLTTFVYISVCLYCPLAVVGWFSLIQAYIGVIEPTTALLVVILANSGGWVNAWGYFHNQRIKNRRKVNTITKITICSLSSSNG